MMSTRRSLFTLGVLLAAFMLLASGANAQPVSAVEVTMEAGTYDSLMVEWEFAHEGGAALTDDSYKGLGFYVYYVKGDEPGLLDNITEIGGATKVDAKLGDMRSSTADSGPTTFMYELEGLEPGTDYVVNVLNYNGDVKNVNAPNTIPAGVLGETGPAPRPSDPREVEVMAGDKMLMVSWRAPVRAAGGSTTIKLEKYVVRWRWSQTADEMAGDWTMYPPKDSKSMLGETKYDITSLENGIMYDVQVQAINEAGGKSDWSPGDDNGDDAARGTPMVVGGATPTPTPTPTPALPLFGAFALGAGLFAAGRSRLRRRAQRQLTR